MAEKTIDERRREIFEEIDALVQRLGDLESEEQNIRYFPGGHVLVVGFDVIDEDDDMVGSVAVYPKNGSQASWKSLGMMHQAIHLQQTADR